MSPTVSINLCCYNGEKYLEETLQSIFAQTFKDWELVVINDGSTDSTEEIIKSHMNEGWPIVYHYQTNAGLSAARNKALELSSGSYIAFIDQDDLWLPEKLEKQVPLFADEQVGLVHSDTLFFKDDKVLAQPFRKTKPPQGLIFRELLVNYQISLETVMVRMEALKSLDEWFDENLALIEERDVFVRLAYRWQIAFADQVLGKWRVHESSSTHKRFGQFATENELLLEKLERRIPNFHLDYEPEIEMLRDRIAFQRGVGLFMEGKATLAREHLCRIRSRRKKYFLAYLMTFFPSSWSSFFEDLYWRFLR